MATESMEDRWPFFGTQGTQYFWSSGACNALIAAWAVQPALCEVLSEKGLNSLTQVLLDPVGGNYLFSVPYVSDSVKLNLGIDVTSHGFICYEDVDKILPGRLTEINRATMELATNYMPGCVKRGQVSLVLVFALALRYNMPFATQLTLALFGDRRIIIYDNTTFLQIEDFANELAVRDYYQWCEVVDTKLMLFMHAKQRKPREIRKRHRMIWYDVFQKERRREARDLHDMVRLSQLERSENTN
jgi:hypothetical protein